MSDPNVLKPGTNCWRVEKANRLTAIVDGSTYFRAVKQAIANARQQIIMIGWDFDTRIELEPDEQTIEGPNSLGPFLNWVVERRPHLDLKILKWDLGMIESLKRGETPLFILKWMASNDVDIALDGAHPAGASHHQKVIVIDDNIAFCGGIDITKGRWDTRDHLDHNPDRHSARGDLLGPWHDATTCVDGGVAKALGEMARMRWKRAEGGDVMVPDTANDPWPQMLEAQFEDVEVAVARTLGAFDEYPQVSEIEELTLDIIAAAKSTLYIESQYFASRTLAEAIIERLQEKDGPEIVVVNPDSQDGWLEEKTMGSARAKLLRMVRRADRFGRFKLYYPVTEQRSPIYVHAKIMVADDRILKIGSANLNNRSMGFDTECDLCVEAKDCDVELRGRIKAFRDDLLSEHLGTDIETIRGLIEETGSAIRAIESLCHKGRGLEELEIRQLDESDEVMAENDLMDPERPTTLVDVAKRWMGA